MRSDTEQRPEQAPPLPRIRRPAKVTEEEYEYEVEVPYEYYTLNVTLTNKNLGM